MLQLFLDYGGFSFSFVKIGAEMEDSGGAAKETTRRPIRLPSQMWLQAHPSRSSEDDAHSYIHSLNERERKKNRKSL